MNILVTGGAGFLGSHLCERLLDEGHHVVCVDNYRTGSRKNVEHLVFQPGFSLVEADVTENHRYSETPFQAIFHLASPASPNMKSAKSYMSFPIETLLTNSAGTHHLLEIAKKDKAKFLFTSTSEVYGDPLVSPQPETYFGNVNPNGIRSVYDEAKRFGEAISFAYLRKFDVDVRIVRLFNTYGPRMQPDDGRVVSNFIMQCLHNKPITVYGDGLQTRSFSYVSDTIDGIIKAMFCEQTKGEVFNIGNPDERTIADIANTIKQLTNAHSDIISELLPQDDPKVRRPNITKAKQLLSWEPKVSLTEGLQETIAYFQTV